MAANTHPSLVLGNSSVNSVNTGRPLYASASVSVGGGDWASEVLSNVVPDQKQEEEEPKVQEEVKESPEEQVRKIVLEKKRLFHSQRCLELKNLPEGVTEQDIRVAFPDLVLTSVTIEKNDGRYRAGARLTLASPELLDDWPRNRENVFVKNKEVSVCVGSSDQWVCVARLPLSLSESGFQTLVSAYGKVRAAFLMVSERSGKSKGYGLVKYCSNEAAAQARQLLDGRDLDNHSVQADWLNSTHIAFRQLHSKCLYVDQLPANYRDMAQYRRVFSVVKNPPYCQIAMRNGCIQDWGLVEFFDSDETEQTQERMNGFNLGGRNIRVHFCIPGINAINIHMKVVSSPADPSQQKKALLEDTPSSSVYSQLQKLTDQNPVFAQNLQSIIQTQIATIQTGGEQRRSPAPRSSPSPDEQQAIDAHAQAALMILLTAERQAQTGESSLLHNPEVCSVLQSLVCQEGRGELPDPYARIMNIPGITMALGQPPTVHYPPPHHPSSSSPSPAASTSPPPIIANNLNLLSNTASLNQLLGVISAPPTSQPSPPPPPPSQPPPPPSHTPDLTSPPPLPPPHPPLHTAPPPRPALLAHPPPQPSLQTPPPTPHHHQLLQAQLAAAQQLQAQQLQQLQAQQQLAQYYQATQGQAAMVPQYHPFLVPQVPALQPQQAYYLPHQLQQQLQQQQLQQQQLQQLGLQQLGMLPLQQLAVGQELPLLLPPASPLRSPASSVGGSVYTSPSPGGVKRKASIPASPEDSPQGPYIGQHSQGLGGHYADSYWQKKRLKQHY